MHLIKYLIVFIPLFSCTHSSNDKHPTAKEDSTLSPLQKAEAIADIFFEDGDYSIAIPYFDSLISIDSSKGGYYFKRGYCKMRLLNDIGAIYDYNIAIERNYSMKHLAYFYIGLIHKSHGLFKNYNNQIAEFDSALHFYNLCLEIDPNYESALLEKEKVLEHLKMLR